MLKGRDLVSYIYEHGLMDENVVKNGVVMGFITEEDAGVKFGVGSQTVRVWVNQGKMEGINVNGVVLVPFDAVDPRKPLKIDAIKEIRV